MYAEVFCHAALASVPLCTVCYLLVTVGNYPDATPFRYLRIDLGGLSRERARRMWLVAADLGHLALVHGVHGLFRRAVGPGSARCPAGHLRRQEGLTGGQ